MSTETDLFGNPLDAPQGTRPQRPPVNDLPLVERVLQIAELTGYVLVGPSERVFTLGGRHEIEAAPSHEGDAVHQLIDAGWLTKGGSHTYHCYGHTGTGNAVLVPRATKHKARHWRSLAPISCTRTRKDPR
ncbi:MAG: hypothetical protein JWQ81_6067 [Amycolatopsis sp.]|uniref:hypothetical protein n=1 Tax=Amycolatopsis sp. TaxID=37632 RepID=UPI002635956F|nr:hypothetical protein [Amycolatopsis sp.]MCU1685328.1 hypothetical protein [Amycolatopsis sp.]